MIGLNDVESEIFYLDDARKVGGTAHGTACTALHELACCRGIGRRLVAVCRLLACAAFL